MPDTGHAQEPATCSVGDDAVDETEPKEQVVLLSEVNRGGFLPLQLPGGSMAPCAVFRCRVDAKAGGQEHGIAALYPAVTIIRQLFFSGIVIFCIFF